MTHCTTFDSSDQLYVSVVARVDAMLRRVVLRGQGTETKPFLMVKLNIGDYQLPSCNMRMYVWIVLLVGKTYQSSKGCLCKCPVRFFLTFSPSLESFDLFSCSWSEKVAEVDDL